MKEEFCQGGGAAAAFSFACTFPGLLRALWPAIPTEIVDRYIKYYEFGDEPLLRRHLSREQIQRIFTKYDRNGDGVLTRHELRDGLLAEGLDEAWDLYKSEVVRFDFNHDNGLSMDEFIMWMALLDDCQDVVRPESPVADAPR